MGGVANYTRPLARKFVDLGHNIFYFYSGAWNKRYNWLLAPYLRINKKNFPFECAELINSPNWIYNYGNPLLDISVSSVERLFTQYIKKIKPEIMHVHSRLGLPASLIEVASKQGVKVFNTIHTYGFLCQKRVLIDNNGLLCEGPVDLGKCAECIGYLNINKLKFIARIKSINKDLVKLAVEIKQGFNSLRHKNKASRRVILNYAEIKEQLQKRLAYMIALMNECVIMNICVSNDVKKTLINYGVKEDKLLVQYIGSKIAEKQKFEKRQLHQPIVIGNIGGVGYYKGIHVLIEAVRRLKGADFILKIFGKYNEVYVKNIMKGHQDLPIKFFGKYDPTHLPEILSQIDIMVFPSICNDTAPQTIFESYSAGIPIIASNIGGFPDFIKEGINGYLFRAGDSQDLAKKIQEVLSNPQKILDLSTHIPRLKTISKNALELVSLYKNAL
jgi:glycosyltransferase involved in cell wall biosynthesis